MSIEIRSPTADDVPQLAAIFFNAFKEVSESHNFPHDIPDVDTAATVMGTLVSRPDFHGMIAVDSATPKIVMGFNFVQISDAVGGVGPLGVDQSCQSQGVGKRLMREIVDWCRSHHGPQIRLLQETINTVSLSLYTKLGYVVQEPIVLMSVTPAASQDATVRPLALSDLAACEALCVECYKVSRRNELAAAIQFGPQMACIPHGRFKDGQLTAYIIPGFFGYGVGKTGDDLLTAVQQAARTAPPPLHRLLVPARTALFPDALRRSFRTIKVFTLMSMGPYDAPTAAWTPSIGY